MKKTQLAVVCSTIVLGALCFSSQALAKTEVNFWYSGGAKPQQLMKDLIAEFNQNQDEYEIKGALQGDYQETFQKLQAGLASKTAPSLALVNSVTGKTLARRGVLRDLRPYMDAEFNFADFVAAFRRQVTDADGSVHAIPAYGTTQVLYYNRQMLADLGFRADSLKTWQGLSAVAAKAARRDARGETVFYGWEPMWGNGNLIDAAFSNGAEVLSDDGKKVLIDSPAWVEVFEGFRKWIHEDKIMRIHHGGQGWEYWYKTIDDVMKGRALGYTGSSGDQGDLDFAKIAAAPQPGWGANPSAPQAGALEFVLPKGTDDKAAQGAFAFIRYYTKAANTARWSMFTGYIPVRNSVTADPGYKAYTDKNPQALVPLTQAGSATPDFLDPTGGKILDALAIAADQIEIENVPAQKALQQAAKSAQRALDRANRP
ncbi:extracellular solute-binding protein [Brenneria populi]|uniref:Extracellular solute-binding protein n=1 Tax=Brenneria populi TaxID=1505588 RepID=A0ABU6JKM6_9GAMM|nr:extracellular solute-binding protein [Brenneria populi Li et al. 2015]